MFLVPSNAIVNAPATTADGGGRVDRVFHVPPGSAPDYESANPLGKLLDLCASIRLAAGRRFYSADDIQYLIPLASLDLFGPQGDDAWVLDATRQDNKGDFQKQNVRDFHPTGMSLARGWVAVNDWTGPFLRLSYPGGPDSSLARAAGGTLGSHVRLWLKVAGRCTPDLLEVPYVADTGCYEVELWGYPGTDLRDRLDEAGRAAVDRGELIARPDLIRGTRADFARQGEDDLFLNQVSADCAMHPTLPLDVEVAWSDASGHAWDSQGGANYHHRFNMILRGTTHCLAGGLSGRPHGGIGTVHYHNVLSNYGRYDGMRELARSLEPWQFDAFGHKGGAGRSEPFFAVQYVDVAILEGHSGIGLHRHRDNQEIFFLLRGQAVMALGDWCKMPDRERCIEVRTLPPGHLVLLKPGQLHGLMNMTDSEAVLLTFGGYD
jgi:mannose-6-phosphate isomerase-like protein (cupin superfamily)